MTTEEEADTGGDRAAQRCGMPAISQLRRTGHRQDDEDDAGNEHRTQRLLAR